MVRQPSGRSRHDAALKSAAPHVRTALGKQVRLKYIPELVFREDPAIAQAERVEAIIRELHRGDSEPGSV